MARILKRWTEFVVTWPRLILAVMGLLTLIAAWIAVSMFHMNSDTGRLIRQEAEWRTNHDAFLEAFPQYDQNTFVVVSGHQPAAVISVARTLAEKIARQKDVFKTVYLPAGDEYIDQHALLFMDTDDLNDTVSRLADAQPLLTAVAEDGLRGVLTLLNDALGADETLPTGFEEMIDALDIAVTRALSSDNRPISWRDELFQADESSTYYQVIFVQGRQEFGEDLPNGLIMGRLNEAIATFDHPYLGDVLIRLSGLVPLEHGEIESALDSAQLAGTLALVILVAVLVWGVRSIRIIAATYLAMLCGLIWTAAFAMLVVGQYNTISIIFLVMFIGLGVDFAVHLCLKYQEACDLSRDRNAALIETGVELGPAITLCGLTSAVGFLSFVPTDYVGLAEMGIISGGGMIIAIIVSLTLIPAFFAVVRQPRQGTTLPFTNQLTRLVDRHHRKTALSTLVLMVILAAIASQARFDYSTLSLKDPDSEAMVTLRELHEKNIITDYSIMFLAKDSAEAQAIKGKLLALPEVAEVKTPQDYLPQDQEEKLFMLEDAAFLLDSLFYPRINDSPFPDEAHVQLLQEIAGTIDGYLLRPGRNTDLDASLLQLKDSVASLAAAGPGARQKLSDLVVPPLRDEITWLSRAMMADPVTLEDLPQQLKERLLAIDGREVVAVTPAEDVVPVESMRKYTTSVMSVAPGAVGRPVLDLGIGDIVVRAFSTAIAIAVAVIFGILLVALRSFTDSILVFIPLAMTALFTLAFSVIADLPLNMANVVVIPLIFGLGVDNGIHIAKRFHQSHDAAELAQSSTPKAVFLSNLTTLGTFFALIFSTHQGIYSIGILLTVALACLMALTLISLPALLETFSKSVGPIQNK